MLDVVFEYGISAFMRGSSQVRNLATHIEFMRKVWKGLYNIHALNPKEKVCERAC